MRIGIKGETKINENLTGYGHWEALLNKPNFY